MMIQYFGDVKGHHRGQEETVSAVDVMVIAAVVAVAGQVKL